MSERASDAEIAHLRKWSGTDSPVQRALNRLEAAESELADLKRQLDETREAINAKYWEGIREDNWKLREKVRRFETRLAAKAPTQSDRDVARQLLANALGLHGDTWTDCVRVGVLKESIDFIAAHRIASNREAVEPLINALTNLLAWKKHAMNGTRDPLVLHQINVEAKNAKSLLSRIQNDAKEGE